MKTINVPESELTGDRLLADYSQLGQEEFNDLLEELLIREPAGNLLQIPGIYEVLSEHFNNEVLDLWVERNPEKAWPNGREE